MFKDYNNQKNHFINRTALLISVASLANVYAQGDSLGLTCDNFDLYAALDLYKQSSNTEDFEKAINNPDHHINKP